MRQKLFVGPQVRALRLEHGLKLEPCAARLGISVSYLSQIEANQRPATSRVLLALTQAFDTPIEAFEAHENERMIADLRAAIAESGSPHGHVSLADVRQVAQQAPTFARRFLDLHRANSGWPSASA